MKRMWKRTHCIVVGAKQSTCHLFYDKTLKCNTHTKKKTVISGCKIISALKITKQGFNECFCPWLFICISKWNELKPTIFKHKVCIWSVSYGVKREKWLPADTQMLLFQRAGGWHVFTHKNYIFVIKKTSMQTFVRKSVAPIKGDANEFKHSSR